MDCLIWSILSIIVLIIALSQRSFTLIIIESIIYSGFSKNKNARLSGLKRELDEKVLRKNPTFAKMIEKHILIFSWLFLLILLISVLFLISTTINIVKYGSCENQYGADACEITNLQQSTTMFFKEHNNPIHMNIDKSTLGTKDAKVKITIFDSTSCKESQDTSELIRKLVSVFGDDIYINYIEIPDSINNMSSRALICFNELSNKEYWPFHYSITTYQQELNDEKILSLIKDRNVNNDEIILCLNSNLAKSELNENLFLAKSKYIEEVPTIIIGEREIVGTNDFEKYEREIQKQLNQNN